MHTNNSDWALQAADKAACAEELEDLVAQIKSIIESPFHKDASIRSLITREIEKAGY
jgi:hypothetical protein